MFNDEVSIPRPLCFQMQHHAWIVKKIHLYWPCSLVIFPLRPFSGRRQGLTCHARFSCGLFRLCYRARLPNKQTFPGGPTLGWDFLQGRSYSWARLSLGNSRSRAGPPRVSHYTSRYRVRLPHSETPSSSPLNQLPTRHCAWVSSMLHWSASCSYPTVTSTMSKYLTMMIVRMEGKAFYSHFISNFHAKSICISLDIPRYK